MCYEKAGSCAILLSWEKRNFMQLEFVEKAGKLFLLSCFIRPWKPEDRKKGRHKCGRHLIRMDIVIRK